MIKGVLLCASLVSARLVDRHPFAGRESLSPHPSAGKQVCNEPITKKKVTFPEHIAGRASQYNMYSGYVNVTSEDWLFYWFFEAKHSNKTNTPTILWSNGGPGCSAMEGATTENGPLILDMIKQSFTLQSGQFSDNPYAWNNEANVLYVDQPRYVGFSFGKGKYVTSSVEAGKDIVKFLLGWRKLFPTVLTQLVIAAESYGGHYVPAWAEAINNYNDKAASGDALDLEGILIGNGIVNETVQSDSLYVDFLKGADLIPANASPHGREQADKSMQKHIGYSPNYYDYRIKDIQCEACYSYNYTTWSYWFLQQEVLDALHVCGDAGDNAFAGAAGGCIDFPTGFDNHDHFDYSAALARSLDKGIKVTFYYGKQDRACNYVGGYAMAKALEWKGSASFNAAPVQPLMIGGVEAGQVMQHGGLTFVQIEAAGHMVPMDQPAASSWVLTDLLRSL